MEDKKWKTLKSELIFNRPPWMTVRKDMVELPNGKVNPEFYVLEYPTWINVIAITPDGMFVMERQYRYGLGETSYEICAGVAEKGETPEQAARRELEEETGYTGGTWQLLTVISGNPSVTNNLTYCYLARGVERTTEQHLDATEDIEVVLMREDEVLQLLKDDEIKQALMAAPLWKYFYLNKDKG
ncbi:MAG: NUDIX hydrolase [Bacteroidales bacterium]|nr:NUDIX hydrolase [Bacteroidales bacterium]